MVVGQYKKLKKGAILKSGLVDWQQYENQRYLAERSTKIILSSHIDPNHEFYRYLHRRQQHPRHQGRTRFPIQVSSFEKLGNFPSKQTQNCQECSLASRKKRHKRHSKDKPMAFWQTRLIKPLRSQLKTTMLYHVGYD